MACSTIGSARSC